MKLVVPGTVMIPVWLILPPAVTVRLPPLVSVVDERVMPALSYCSVKLRKLARLDKLARVGDELILRNATSFHDPLSVILPLKLLAEVFSSRLDNVVVVSVIAPALAACVMAPDCETAPPAVIKRLPLPIVEVSKTKAPLLLRATVKAPLLFSETAPRS